MPGSTLRSGISSPDFISSRCGLDEDVMSAEGYTMGDPGKIWETCMTTNRNWGYNSGDEEWKTPYAVIFDLLTCSHNGGNYLLNVGPKKDGTIPAQAVKLLKKTGDWIGRNGAAVYGTDPHPFAYADQHLSTSRGNTAYMPLSSYNGPETTVAGIGNAVTKVRILATGETVSFRQEGNRIFLTGLPRKKLDPVMTILVFELDGKPVGIENPLKTKSL